MLSSRGERWQFIPSYFCVLYSFVIAAPGKLGLVLPDAPIDFAALPPERSVCDAVHDKEEQFVFRDGVAVVVLLLRTELLA